jgi:hypothetical protein
MSDQGYTQPEGNDEEKVLFCGNWPPIVRKIGYYLTFLVGVIIFLIGVIDLISTSVIPLIIGSVVTILSPLWIKSPKGLCLYLKSPLRLTSAILFIGFLIATIIGNYLIDSFIVRIVLGVCLALSGIWYFLSFFENGHKACIACIKACCGKDQQGGETAAS